MLAQSHRDIAQAVIGVPGARGKLDSPCDYLFRLLGATELQQHRREKSMCGQADTRAGDCPLGQRQSLVNAIRLHQPVGLRARGSIRAAHGSTTLMRPARPESLPLAPGRGARPPVRVAGNFPHPKRLL